MAYPELKRYRHCRRCPATGDRQRVYTLDLGSISPNDIRIDETGFVIAPQLAEVEFTVAASSQRCRHQRQVNEQGRTIMSARITELDPQVGGLFADSVVNDLLGGGGNSANDEAGWNDGLADLHWSLTKISTQSKNCRCRFEKTLPCFDEFKKWVTSIKKNGSSHNSRY